MKTEILRLSKVIYFREGDEIVKARYSPKGSDAPIDSLQLENQVRVPYSDQLLIEVLEPHR